MNRLLALCVALVAAGCAADQAAQKSAAAPLPWCNPCTYPSACTSPCAPPVVAAPTPPKKPYVPPPTPALSAAFDPVPGEFQSAQEVKLSSPTPGAVIHYTTDGSTPTAASPAYTGPIAVASTTTIRALVTAPDVPESSVSQGEYVITPPPPPPPPAKVEAAAPPPPPPAAPPPPAPTRIKVTEKKIELLEKVFFATSKTTIKPQSFPLLDEVAQVLVSNPQVKKVLVEGHTDNTGAAATNTKLSQGRAEAVKAYLVKKGVAADRLDAKGFGPTQPIADNKTAKGRDANRRVEFTIE